MAEKDKFKEYVPVANSFTQEGGLSSKELYLFAYLHTHRNYLKTGTTVATLRLILSEVRFVKKAQDNKKYVVAALNVLIEKGVIIINGCPNLNKDTLHIEYPVFNGYEPVPYTVFQSTRDPEEFMTLCYILKVKRPVSYVELAAVLGCSDRHAKHLVGEMFEKEMISKRGGSYYINKEGEPRQEPNQYHVNVPESKVTTTKVNQFAIVEARPHNWGVQGAKLTEDDYYIFLTSKDEKFRQKCENTIRRLENPTDPSKTAFDFAKFREQAESRIEREQRKEYETSVLAIVDRNRLAIRTAQGDITEYEFGGDEQQIVTVFTNGYANEYSDYPSLSFLSFDIQDLSQADKQQIIKFIEQNRIATVIHAQLDLIRGIKSQTDWEDDSEDDYHYKPSGKSSYDISEFL